MTNDNAIRDRIARLMRDDLNTRTHDAMSTATYRLLLAVMRDAARELSINLPTDNSPLHDDRYDYVSNPIHTLTVARSILELLECDMTPNDQLLTELADDIATYVDNELIDANVTPDETLTAADYLDSVIMLYHDAAND
jgi:DNA-binding ferritin-like protein (Dps family)